MHERYRVWYGAAGQVACSMTHVKGGKFIKLYILKNKVERPGQPTVVLQNHQWPVWILTLAGIADFIEGSVAIPDAAS